MQRALDPAIVRIRSYSGEVVGSGFAVAAGHVVTCAHVVMRALGRKTQEVPAETDTVSLDFPLVAPGIMVDARVEVWHPIENDDKGDIAVLALVSDPPAGILPAYLVVAEDFWSHRFRTLGFPRRYDHGVWASGVLRARQAAGWVQMESSSSGYAVEAGFSGAAVWDDEVAGVVGMTVAADARSDRRAAYLMPAEELIRAWPPLANRTVPPCPYRGLYPFRERDASIFYGRQELTDRLATEVRRRPLVAVVGPSGSGKSSVVFAGLLPHLLQQQRWLCISMRPAHASSPLVALAAAILPFLAPDQTETKRLTALGQLTTLLREGHLPDVVDRVLTRAGKTDLLLVVDQCEELFVRGGRDASEFIGVVLAALQPPQDILPRSLTVVVTLRADFLGQALQNPALAAVLEGAVTTIGQMGRDQLRAAIEGPLPKAVTYEAGLVERILGDVGEEPGSLPLLEFALTLLWERQDRGTLTHSAYEQLGGVSGALASYAERVYTDQLLPDEQEEARHLLVQLVRSSEVGKPVRRIARRHELGEPRWQLGQRLAATRLLVTDRDPTGVESVELVHEALITRWSRLYEWFDQDRAFRTWQEQLRGAVAQWETVQRNEGALLRGMPLAEAERWLTERPDDLGAPERQFIQASRALRSRSVRRLRAVVTVLAILALVASSLGGVALWQRNQATKQSKIAQSRALVTYANLLVSSQPDVAMLLAATAHQMADTAEAINTLTTMANRWQHVDRLIGPSTGGREIAFNPTDSKMVALTSSQGIELWDVEKNIRLSRHDAAGVTNLVFSPDGRTLAYLQKTEQEKKVVLWAHAEERAVQEIPLSIASGESRVNLAFSSDGKLFGACAGQRIQVWSPDPGGPRHSIPLVDGTRCAFGFRGGSRELAYVDGNEIVTWDIVAGSTTKIRPTRTSPPNPLRRFDEQFLFGGSSTFVVAPDGRSAVYTGNSERTVMWWDFDRKEQHASVSANNFPVNAFFTPDSRLAAIDLGSGVALFDVATRTQIASYSLNEAEHFRSGKSKIALSPDGRVIATVGSSGIIGLTDTGQHHVIRTKASRIAIQSPEDKHLTTASSGKVSIYLIGNSELSTAQDPPEGRSNREEILPNPLEGLLNKERAEDLSANGLRYAFTENREQRIHLLDLSSLPAREAIINPIIKGSRGKTFALSLDPSGDFLACAYESEIIIWSTKNQTEVSRVPLPKGYLTTRLAVGPGGRYIAAINSGGKTWLWDTGSDAYTGIALPFDNTRSISFSSNERWLGISGQNEIKLWHLATKQIDPRRIPVGGSSMKFSPDSSLLAAESGEREISIWGVSEFSPILPKGTVRADDFAFTSDNSRLAVIDGRNVFMTPFDTSWALRHICRLVNRNLTHEEWHRYLPESDYVPTCQL